MVELKCPFCQQELETCAKYTDGTSKMWCSKCNLFGDSKLFSELIRTKELLDLESSEHEMCHTQMLKTTEKLERTRKALDVAVDALDAGRTLARIAGFEMLATGMDEAVKQITALEQKD